MRPRSYTYTLAALNRTGYLSNATGATWTLTSTTGPADGLAHLVTIIGDAATNHSAKTAVITGTDASDQAISETVNLPNGTATVTSTKYYKTVTSVVPSATIGADTMDIGWSAVGVTPTYVLDGACLAVASYSVEPGATTANFTVQESNEDPFTAGYMQNCWYTAAAAGSVLVGGVFKESSRAARVLVNSHTSGVIEVNYSQARR